jgi:hypothetical protein
MGKTVSGKRLAAVNLLVAAKGAGTDGNGRWRGPETTVVSVTDEESNQSKSDRKKRSRRRACSPGMQRWAQKMRLVVLVIFLQGIDPGPAKSTVVILA